MPPSDGPPLKDFDIFVFPKTWENMWKNEDALLISWRTMMNFTKKQLSHWKSWGPEVSISSRPQGDPVVEDPQ